MISWICWRIYDIEYFNSLWIGKNFENLNFSICIQICWIIHLTSNDMQWNMPNYKNIFTVFMTSTLWKNSCEDKNSYKQLRNFHWHFHFPSFHINKNWHYLFFAAPMFVYPTSTTFRFFFYDYIQIALHGSSFFTLMIIPTNVWQCSISWIAIGQNVYRIIVLI